MQGVISSVFGNGGVGFVIVQILAIGTVAWMISYVLMALGKGELGNMVKVVATFICLGLVISTVFNTLAKVANVLGIK